MKGIILAGGLGTRLYPLTAITNKHLVPIGNLPMIEYPLHTLRTLGVESISVVTGGEHFKDIAGYLGKVHSNLRKKLSFHYQAEPNGISDAISYAEPSAGHSPVAVILGDNIFEDDFYEAKLEFLSSELGAMIFLKEVPDANRFGVAEIKDGKIISIEEKPQSPKSNLAATGLYFFDSTVFDKIKTLKPSPRGQLEVIDLIDGYIREGRASYHMVNGFWSDAGVPDSRRMCEAFVAKGLEERVLKASGIKLL